jgi:hypothetical protein
MHVRHIPKSATPFDSDRSVLLCVVVERAKKCLDFTVTLFFFHLLACAFYEVRA